MCARRGLIVAAVLVMVAPWSQAARLGAPQRVGPVGTAPAASLLGTVLPFGDGYVEFTSQPQPGQPPLFRIIATPITHDGVVQNDKAITLVTDVFAGQMTLLTGNTGPGPMAAVTDSGYLLCFRSINGEAYTLPLSPSLQMYTSANSHGRDVFYYTHLACNGSSCLLTYSGTPSQNVDGSIIVMGADGVERSRRSLPRAGYPFSALAPVFGGYAFFHGDGVTWLDIDGNATAETESVPNIIAPAIVAHPAGALLIDTSLDNVIACVVSPDRGVVKSARFTLGSGFLSQAVATVGGDGAQFLIAVSKSTFPPQPISLPMPSDVGGILVTADLQITRPWFPIAEQLGVQTSMSVATNGGAFLVAWQRDTYALSAAVTSNASVLQPDGAALVRTPASQDGVALAISTDSALALWQDEADEPIPTRLTRFDGAGSTNAFLPASATIWDHAVWNGTGFALFGNEPSTSKAGPAARGGPIDASGALHDALLGRDMDLIDVWWDGSAYVAATDLYSSQTRTSHLLRLAPDMTVLSDVPLPFPTMSAAGIPGRTMSVSVTLSPGDPKAAVTMLDDRGVVISTTAFTPPQPQDGLYYIVSSNGRDQFILVVAAYTDGTIYASRFTSEGRQLDDLTVPLPKKLPLLLPDERFAVPLVEALGDRWLVVAPHAAAEFPGWKPVDLSTAGTVVKMARASIDRIVLLTSETVWVDDLPLQLLMLRDLVDDAPPRRRAVH